MANSPHCHLWATVCTSQLGVSGARPPTPHPSPLPGQDPAPEAEAGEGARSRLRPAPPRLRPAPRRAQLGAHGLRTRRRPPDGRRDGRMYEAPRGEFARTPALAPPSLLHRVPASRSSPPLALGAHTPTARRLHGRAPGAQIPAAGTAPERSTRCPLERCGLLGWRRVGGRDPPAGPPTLQVPPAVSPLPPALSRCFTTAPQVARPGHHHPHSPPSLP